MKRKIFVCAAYLTMAGMNANAQTKNAVAPPPPPPPPMALLAPPPPPMPPPPPPAIDIIALLAPPPPPAPTSDKIVSREIINSNGYNISIHEIKGSNVVVTQKNGVSKKIKLATWNANRKFYESKYGMLPPPPPPPPTPPIIEKDFQ